jgi:hypothetical protein
MKVKYPFRFEGPKVGDIVYSSITTWPEGSGDEGVTTVEEVEIVHVDDSFCWQERDLSDPRNAQHNWGIFYWVKDGPGHGMTFGDELFLTKEEVEISN